MMRSEWKLEEHLPDVRRFVKERGLRSELRSRLDDTDVVQDVALQAVARLDTFRGATIREFVAWLRAIVARRFSNVLRDQGRSCREPAREVTFEGEISAAFSETPSAIVSRDEVRSILARAVRSLPEKQREVIVLHKLRGLTLRETADIVGVPLPTAASRLNRGLKELRRRLDGIQI